MVPADPKYSQQWHFDLIGDIEKIWDEFDGSGINVAVYDDGMDVGHPDLVDNYDASLESNVSGVDGDYNTSTDAHGTAVGGIIAGVQNGSYGVGVAFGADLTSVDFLNDGQDLLNNGASGVTAFKNLMNEMAKFDVINNSWGSTPMYDSVFNSISSSTSGNTSIYEDGVVYATTNGRNGLGSIIVKAAGNEANNYSLQYNYGVYGNAQGDELNSSFEIILVSATDSNGDVEYYSNYGANVLVAAPAASETTDIVGSDGYSSNAWATDFGGTSAATPVVSGVTALMLDANENLGWRDVRIILAMSASLTGSNIGSSATGYEVGQWGVNDANNWNGGGNSFSLNYGYGMVDAYAAVRIAEVWFDLFDTAKTTANIDSVTLTNNTDQRIYNSTGATSSVTCNTDIELEHVYVTISTDHYYMGDLTIYLVGPDGTYIPLLDQEGLDTDLGTWTFGVTAVMGMSSVGTWSVVVQDNYSGDSDYYYIDYIQIEFLGSEANADSVYTYTDDFLTMLAYDNTRGSLADTDGGADWINMAAITGNVVANLASSVKVDNLTWMTLNGSVENIVTGDGNDVLYGNSDANILQGMRGDDVLVGGDGADTLRGGAGTDAASYSNATSFVTADLINGGSGSGDSAGDIYSSIENLTGSAYNDDLRGTNGNNTISGGAGNDFMMGRNGNDVLIGGAGNDTLTGGDGFDVLNGGTGKDRLNGEAGNDRLLGDDNDDVLYDVSGNNQMFGGSGNDTLLDGNGDGVLFGNTGADRLIGNSGNDRIYGDQGNDKISAGNGIDTIVGGAGNDYMVGGNGADKFVFYQNDGADRIEDFELGQDRLFLDSDIAGTDIDALVANYADVVGGNIVFDFGDGNTITLIGVTDIDNIADDILIIN
ncbi:S8 family serine peptidase [Celeribacter baekdonensis]|uniref:S8 family serine peptidase n=1 Tax=Celeribacter baekdonensis TaxID=875171 RepID=UPI003A954ED1